MFIEWFKHDDNWQDVKNSTMTTIGKSTGKYPDPEWKLKLIRAEHSPIRKLKYSWRWSDIPYWVSVHIVRHKIGIEHFVKTQRTDRTGEERNSLPQDAPVSHECEANAQALISISRKRLCNCASFETRSAWTLVKEKVSESTPELSACMVKECVYRGFCPEIFGCGFDKTDEFESEVVEYRK